LKFKILEFKTRNAISRNGQYKKTEISCLENQNKTRNALQDKKSCLDETLCKSNMSGSVERRAQTCDVVAGQTGGSS